MDSQITAALRGRLDQARGLLAHAEKCLAAGEPDAVVTPLQDLVRSLRPLCHVPPDVWRASRIDPHDLAQMGRQVVAMQDAVARALASTIRGRQVLNARAPSAEGPDAPLYSADGRPADAAVRANRPPGAVA